MTSHSLRGIAACIALLTPLLGHAALVNGNFEANTLAAGRFAILPTLTGWQADTLGVELRRDVAGTAQAGQKFVELDTTGNSAIWQDLATTVGEHYRLSGWYSPRAGVAADSNDIQVLWNGSLLTTLGGSGIGQSNNVWRQFNLSVTGTGVDRLRFAAAGKSDSLGGSLDNIALNTATVPEPASLVLVLVAFGAAGLVSRQRAR